MVYMFSLLNSSVNKGQTPKMYREYGGVGFVCVNWLLPSS